MIGKILFTIAVILVVALIWRTRRPAQGTDRPEPRLINPQAPRRWPIKGLAIGVIAGGLALTGLARRLQP